jgi:hypothetical protein
MVVDCERQAGSQAYVVGLARERLPAIRERLRREDRAQPLLRTRPVRRAEGAR